jgi:hypothetical protein
MWMRSIGAQRRAARVPTEVMQFVADVWQIQSSGNFAIGPRGWVDVNYQKAVAT